MKEISLEWHLLIYIDRLKGFYFMQLVYHHLQSLFSFKLDCLRLNNGQGGSYVCWKTLYSSLSTS